MTLSENVASRISRRSLLGKAAVVGAGATSLAVVGAADASNGVGSQGVPGPSMGFPHAFVGSNQMMLQLITPPGLPAHGRPPTSAEVALGVVDTDAARAFDAVCFDVPLIDVRTGQLIGSGTDCLFNIVPVDLVTVDVAGGGVVDLPIVKLEARTVFHMPGGSFTAAGATAVAPITTGLGLNGFDGALTHITGAIPDPFDGGNIIEATGVFSELKDSDAQARLSGSAGLGNFPAEMAFDCLFVVNKK